MSLPCYELCSELKCDELQETSRIHAEVYPLHPGKPAKRAEFSLKCPEHRLFT